MLKILVVVATSALALAGPASAQSARELSGGPWSCKLVPLTGEPGGDVTLEFKRNGALSGEFYLEMPEEDDTIGMSFSITGEWTLSGAQINMSMTDSELLGAWLNGEELPADAQATLSTSLDDELNSISGESTVAYIARHAMVLEEDDTSISCWR